jgi:GNAT superfamily N-acetyltransferase
MSELEIRLAGEVDVAAIMGLIHALAEYELAPPGAVSVTESLLRETLFGANPGAEVRLAYWDGTLAGYALFFHNFSSWRGRRGLYLEDLFVLPEMRGRGIGKALLREVARLAVERGCARMEWLVLDWNKTAIEFYLSQGARPMDEWTTFRLDGPALEAMARNKS